MAMSQVQHILLEKKIENKILCAAFGTWPSGPPPTYLSMSHLNILKNLGLGWDPLPPLGTMSHKIEDAVCLSRSAYSDKQSCLTDIFSQKSWGNRIEHVLLMHF